MQVTEIQPQKPRVWHRTSVTEKAWMRDHERDPIPAKEAAAGTRRCLAPKLPLMKRRTGPGAGGADPVEGWLS